jgi:hypothetical protein
MKQKIIKISAILIAISLLFGGCISEDLTFETQRIVLEENLDFTNYRSALAAGAAASYYKDNDGSFVLWWEDGYNIENLQKLDKDDPAYDNTCNHYLIRIFPGEPERTEKVQIREWEQWHLEPRIYEANLGAAMWQNERGNTVIQYVRMYSNTAEPTEHEDGEWDYIFEEYDKDFNLIKKASYSAYDLPGGIDGNYQNFVAKDDNDNYYVATGRQIVILNADFDYLGVVDDISENESDSYIGSDSKPFLLVNKGGDGAVYAYWFDEEIRQFYKIDPKTLTSKYMFDLGIEESASLYPGEGTTLFYGVGEYLYSIDEKGKTKRVFKWGTDGIAPYFVNNRFSPDDLENSEGGDMCNYEKNGNFYNITVVDKDGDSQTLNDNELVLYEFIKK